MSRYQKYKPTGIEWIGDIPEHWEAIRLKFIGDAIIGITYTPSEITNNEEDILVLRSSNIQNGKLAFNDCVYIKKEIKPKHLTKEGDILICARNGSIKLVGKSALIFKEYEGNTFGAFMSVFRSKYGQFLFYFFNSQIFRAQAGLFSTSTINQITSDTLNNLIIALPPLKEQIAIADYLDKKTAAIDTVITKKQKLMALLQEERTAIINQAVTKGINPNAKLKPTGKDWLGEIPEHWEVVPMTKYLEKIVDYRGRTPKKVDFGIFLITARNIKKGKIDYETSREYIEVASYEEVMSRGELRKGDVLFTTEAPLGEVANVDRLGMAVAQRVIKFSGKAKVLDNYYLKYWLLSYNFQLDLNSYATGSTALGIKSSRLHHLKLVLPPKNEQTQIVDFIVKQTEKIDTTIEKIEKEINLLNEYRTSLISEVVTGKLKIL